MKRGNLIKYPGAVSTPTAYIKTMKYHWNSFALEKRSINMCKDVKYFILA